MSEELIGHLNQEVRWLVNLFSGGFRQQIQANSQPSGLKNLQSHMALSSPRIKHLCCCDKSVMHYRMEKAFSAFCDHCPAEVFKRFQMDVYRDAQTSLTTPAPF